jgi:hypothetical protein
VASRQEGRLPEYLYSIPRCLFVSDFSWSGQFQGFSLVPNLKRIVAAEKSAGNPGGVSCLRGSNLQEWVRITEKFP